MPSASKGNQEAEAIVANFEKTIEVAKSQYAGQYDWLIVTHHKSTQTVAKHAADSDIENYVDAGFEQVMADQDVDFVLGGHDHVYSRSFVLNGDGEQVSERLDTINNPQGVIYLTGNCSSDMQYYTPFEKWIKPTMPIIPYWPTASRDQWHIWKEKMPVMPTKPVICRWATRNGIRVQPQLRIV